MSKKTNRNTKKAIKALKRKRNNRAYYVSGGVMGVDTPEGTKHFRFNAYSGGTTTDGNSDGDSDGDGVPNDQDPYPNNPNLPSTGDETKINKPDPSDPAKDVLVEREDLPKIPDIKPMEVAQAGMQTVPDYAKAAKETKLPKGYTAEWRPEDNAFFVQGSFQKPQMLSPEEYADFFNVDYSQYTKEVAAPGVETAKEDIEKLAVGEDVDISAPSEKVSPTDITATSGTVTKAQMPGEYNLDFIRLAAQDKLPANAVVKVRSDGKLSISTPGRAADIYEPEDLINQFGLEGDFGGPLKAAQATPSTITAAEAGTATAATQKEIKEEAKAKAATIGPEDITVTAPTLPTAEEIAAAKVTAPTREEETVTYATAKTEAEKYGIDLDSIQDPTVKQRTAQTISEREEKDLLDIVTKEGINLEDIPEFAIAKQRTAQVGQAAQGIAQQLGEVPSVDLQGRRAITGQAPQGDAAQIGGVPTLAASQMQAVTGVARSTAAADMMAVVGNMPPKITAAISEDPATVEAQIADETLEVKAAVAALPQEALVSVQMEKLLEGLEEGKTPAWARPAVAAVEQQMARRGLTTSTVGRDALFNAIIQSALPMAQSNAQALQQNAQQNLSNQQQANLASAQNTMQIRLANLSNQQTAASQTAQMAQQIKVQQAQFRQEAVLTTAQQEQQVRMQNIQNAQQRASQESAQRQQAALANLDAGARMDLANLEALNMAGRENLNATQQARLASYQANVNRIMRQAELTQDMEKANLDATMRMELTNLAEQNAAARDTMSAEQQERLVNLQTLVDFKKTNASLAQQMDIANMSNAQQMELANLAERAATDSANMTEANRFRLQELTTYVNVMSQNEQLRQNAELAQLSASEKVSLANLTAKNQADSESMSATNVANLQSFEKRMQAAQVNAQLAQQLGLANLSNQQQAAMFNAQINANLDMKQFDFEQQAAIANSKFMQTLTLKDLDNEQQAALQQATLNAQRDLAEADLVTKVSIENSRNFLQRDLANLQNEQQTAVLNAQMKQQRLLSNQAAENAAQQFNATSENQTNQFMASLASNMEQFNASQANNMQQFNASEANRIAAIEAGNDLEADRFNAQIAVQVDQFNAENAFRREQWNAANAQAIEQANVAWRRQTNLANTAAQNAANQLAAQQSFQLTAGEQNFLWQQLRDEASYLRQAYENEQQRRTTLFATALANESESGSNRNIKSLVSGIIDAMGGS